MIEETAPGPALEIQSQAAEFLVARRNGRSWSEFDEQSLNAWLAQSMAHRIAFWRLESVWNRADRLNALRPMAPAKTAVAANPRKRIAPFAFAAAVVAGIAALGLSTNLLWNQPRVTSYSTPIGGRETIRLADGTTIELNTNTVVRTALTEKRRTVELVRGEAFFQVRHDERRPFVLLAANHRVIDLGTKFLAREDGTRLKVVLIEGSAKVETGISTDNAKSALLKPGDEAVATARDLTITRKSDKQLESELGWQRGVLVFQRATLVDVAREYNRYNSRKIIIADTKAGARLITATLPTNDVTGFARMAKNFLGLHVEEREGEIVISH